MADRQIAESTEHLTFAAAGIQTISIPSIYTALVTFLDISAPSLRTADVKVGTTQIWKGWLDEDPVQFKFGKGRGSGIAGDNITVQVNGASEVFVGVRQEIVGV